MFSESKDEVALILFGCDDTVNPLADGDCYEHVCIKRHLGVADFDLLQMVQKELKSGKSPADCILDGWFQCFLVDYDVIVRCYVICGAHCM